MLMIGVALGLSLKKEYLHLIYTDIGLRLLISVVFAAFIYVGLDYSMDIKRVLMVLVFAPVAGMACYYTAKLKLKIEVAAASVPYISSFPSSSCRRSSSSWKRYDRSAKSSSSKAAGTVDGLRVM